MDSGEQTDGNFCTMYVYSTAHLGPNWGKQSVFATFPMQHLIIMDTEVGTTERGQHMAIHLLLLLLQPSNG